MKSLDQAIRRHVADFVKRQCPVCLGTRKMYRSKDSFELVPCTRCVK